jgi:hypothetical protein
VSPDEGRVYITDKYADSVSARSGGFPWRGFA